MIFSIGEYFIDRDFDAIANYYVYIIERQSAVAESWCHSGEIALCDLCSVL